MAPELGIADARVSGHVQGQRSEGDGMRVASAPEAPASQAQVGVLATLEESKLQRQPIQVRIEQILLRRIENGDLPVGARLPSESQLQREFHASRTPVRNALRLLQDRGLIYTAQGRGSFVANGRIGCAIRDLVGFAEEIRRLGHDVRAETLEVELGAPPQDVRYSLELRDNERAIFVRRLFVVDDMPLACFSHWLIPDIGLPRVRAASNFLSLSELMRQAGREPQYASEVISAGNASATMAAVLCCGVGDALLVSRVVKRDIGRAPVEHTTSSVRGDRYELRANRVRLRR